MTPAKIHTVAKLQKSMFSSEKFRVVKFLISAGNVNDNLATLPLLLKINSKTKHDFDRELYKKRNVVENFFVG